MTVQEDIIEILVESGTTGFKKGLQILYFLMVKKNLNEKTTVKDIQHQLSIPQKSVYNSVAELEAEGLVNYEYGIRSKREKEIHITGKGKELVYRKIFSLFIPHKRVIRKTIPQKASLDEVEQLSLLDDFLGYIEPRILELFQNWIYEQMGSKIAPVFIKGFETHFHQFLSHHITDYLNSVLTSYNSIKDAYMPYNHFEEVSLDG